MARMVHKPKHPDNIVWRLDHERVRLFGATMNRDQLTIEIATRHYLICALWTSVDEKGEPLDSRFDLSDISEETTSKAREDVSAFLDLLAQEGIEWAEHWNPEQLGHDFWLTRNGHGAGFWDRYLLRDEHAHTVGKHMADIVGDDGQIYA